MNKLKATIKEYLKEYKLDRADKAELLNLVLDDVIVNGLTISESIDIHI